MYLSQVEDVKGVGNYVTCKACTWTLRMVESYIFTEQNEDKVLAWGRKASLQKPRKSEFKMQITNDVNLNLCL